MFPSDSLTIEDLSLYNSRKTISQKSSPLKGMLMHAKPLHGKVGIFNQGATCYLNTLLQYLFNDVTFRTAIYSSEVDHPILRELKRFFISLQYSDISAISSQELMKSFGWSKSQASEQHDVHELFSILMDSLSKISPQLETIIKELFYGSQRDVLVCSKCSHKQETKSEFINLSIDLPDDMEISASMGDKSGLTKNISTTLTSLLDHHIKPETLDDDNKWLCSNCSENVRAIKSHVVEKLPDRLVIHFKRFRFDPTTKRRRKVGTPIIFSEKLSSSSILPGSNGSDDYLLNAVLVHTGTAMGGHYRAFIKNISNPDNSWFDFNDASVLELTKDDVTSYFTDPSSELPTPAKVTRGISEHYPPHSPRIGDPPANYRGLIHENAYMLIYQRKQQSKPINAMNDSVILSNSLLKSYLDEIEKNNKELQIIRKLNVIKTQVFDINLFMKYKGKLDTDNLLKVLSSLPSEQPMMYKSSDDTTYVYHIGACSLANDYNDDRLIKICCIFDKRLQLNQITEIMYQYMVNNNFIHIFDSTQNEDVMVDRSNVRLRQYIESSQRCGETYTSKQSLSLKELYDNNDYEYSNLEQIISLFIETRLDNDPVFIDFNANDILIDLVQYEDIAMIPGIQNIDRNDNIEINQSILKLYHDRKKVLRTMMMIGDDQSITVDKFLNDIQQVLKADKNNIKLILLHNNTYSKRYEVIELSNLNGILRRDYPIANGDEVIVEICPSDSSSQSLTILKKLFTSTVSQSLVICFNDPRQSLQSKGKNIPISYDFTIEVTNDTTIQMIKDKMSEVLGIQDSSFSFFLRRYQNGPQFKDLQTKLVEAGLTTMSIIHLEIGKGCDVGEYFLSFEVDVSAISSVESIGIASKQKQDHITLKDLAISEKISVYQLKEILHNKWKDIAPSHIPIPKSPNHIRLRDGKSVTSITTNNTITNIASLLRDDRILIRCLLGLSDGRKIIIQVLDEPEILAIDDMVMTIVNFNYSSRSIAIPMDIPMKRTITIGEFYELLNTKYNVLFGDNSIPIDSTNNKEEKLEIAKILSSGQPLTLKNANKLKWININSSTLDGIDSNMSKENLLSLTIDRPPLTLRDGSIIAVRHRYDYDSAKAAALAKRSTNGVTDEKAFDETVPVAAGGGINAVKARANIGQIRAMSSQGKRNRSKEEGIKIEVFAKSGMTAE